MREWRQFDLQAGDSRLVCWLEDDSRLTAGRQLTLKQMPEVIWTVTCRYAGPLLSSPPRQTWRVGGLS